MHTAPASSNPHPAGSSAIREDEHATRSSRDLIVNIQRMLAAAAVIAFVVGGLHGVLAGRSRRTAGGGRLDSTDAYLAGALHVRDGGQGLLRALSDLPPLQPLAIIAPQDNVYGPILLAAVGSITWPHEVCLLPAGNVRKTLETLRHDHFAAALLYTIPPPAPGAGDRQIGLLTVVPLSK